MRFIFMLAMVAAVVGLVACGGGSQETADTEGSGNDASAENNETAGMPESHQAETEKADSEMAGEDNPILERSMKKDPGPADEMAVIKTNMGNIKVRFFPKQAPLAVANFKGLAAKGYYEGIIFHRVIENFMIQGGDPTGTGFSGESLWGGKFEDEFDQSLRFNRPGILAMANSGPNTNGSQFFITQVPTPHLNDKHTIFGEVVEGMDVVNAICGVRTDQRNKPAKPIIIESVEIQTGA